MTTSVFIGRRTLLLCAALLGVLAACRSGSGRKDRTEAANVWWETTPEEARINADAVPDVVGLCTDPEPKSPPRLCAVDGVTFAILWRSEPLVGVGGASMLPFGVAGDRVVLVDALGVVHVYDIHTGRALPQSHRFAERASHVCAPREHPGKLWLATSDGQGWLLDPATAKPAALPQPRSCLLADCWSAGSAIAYAACEVPLVVPDFAVLSATVDGEDGLAVITSLTPASEERLAGFVPGATAPRWTRRIPPDDPLRSRSGDIRPETAKMAAGRIVAAYEDLSGARHLVSLDAKTGNAGWAVVTKGDAKLVLTPSRLYELRSPRLDVRDAATGKLLGGVGAPDRSSRIP